MRRREVKGGRIFNNPEDEYTFDQLEDGHYFNGL